MNNSERTTPSPKRRHPSFVRRGALGIALLSFLALVLASCGTQTSAPETVSGPVKVTQIDETGLKDLLKPSGKPRLINFWATWCDPCREEFPDLVKIGNDHKDKVELITVSLDEPAEIEGNVTKFLTQMKSASPAFLLSTKDQDAAIEMVSKDWQGALPFTILINAQGEAVYSKQGKFSPGVLVTAIEKL
jgi:thiol-disulfide isomerase/thioredoxin